MTTPPDKPMPNSRNRPFQFSLATALLGMAGFALLLGSAVSFFRGANDRIHRHDCPRNLKAIGLALHQYHDKYGCFPPAHVVNEDGTQTHSWRTLILPFLGDPSLYDACDFDEPWNGPTNRRVGEHLPGATTMHGRPFYQCRKETLGGPQTTAYVAVLGPATAWADGEPVCLDQIDHPENTMMVIEVAGSGIHWMEPQDLRIEELTRRRFTQGSFATPGCGTEPLCGSSCGRSPRVGRFFGRPQVFHPRRIDSVDKKIISRS